jgi:hypothetical protein
LHKIQELKLTFNPGRTAMPISPNASVTIAARAAIALCSMGVVGEAMADGAAPAASHPAVVPTQRVAPARQLQPIPPSVTGAVQEFETDPAKVTIERLQNGTRLYHLNGQGMQALSAHIKADGKIEYVCTDKVEQVSTQAGKKIHEH